MRKGEEKKMRKDIKILVSDDFELIQTIFKNSLTKLGYENVDFVSNGKEAWNKIQEAHKDKNPYSLVFLDWNMPEMDGYEVLTKCRSEVNFRDLPIIMVTAESELNSIVKAVSKGVSGYIIKPFSIEVLNERIQSVKHKIEKQDHKVDDTGS